ncbi:hypothetical protein BDN72DRAFT_897317 [Pluteus cervinus]|uniref:Uncharacterized protein n=1 Tax=Pluteus cervinus TaxID=181527 RepID=A0ACD3AUQ3_9AGAR|nr:hypothetical protein BDN72DRAFT_897317 [Pluteus cervinus]
MADCLPFPLIRPSTAFHDRPLYVWLKWFRDYKNPNHHRISSSTPNTITPVSSASDRFIPRQRWYDGPPPEPKVPLPFEQRYHIVSGYETLGPGVALGQLVRKTLGPELKPYECDDMSSDENFGPFTKGFWPFILANWVEKTGCYQTGLLELTDGIINAPMTFGGFANFANKVLETFGFRDRVVKVLTTHGAHSSSPRDGNSYARQGSKTATSGDHTSVLKTQPDIAILVRVATGDSTRTPAAFSYATCIAPTEVQLGPTRTTEANLLQAAYYAQQCLRRQPEREGVYTAVFSENQIRIYHFNRSLAVKTSCIDFHKNPVTFIQFILGLSAQATDSSLGCDFL